MYIIGQCNKVEKQWLDRNQSVRDVRHPHLFAKVYQQRNPIIVKTAQLQWLK
jgi:hypothetical protein